MHTKAQQTNYHFSHTESTTAEASKIWNIWTDVPHWQEWDTGLKEATLDGEFNKGSKGKLIPDKGPKSKFIISELDEGTSYTMKTRIPLGWLIVKRRLEQQNGQTLFTHEVEFTGPLKKILGNKLGKRYRAMLPKVLTKIKTIAEK